MRIIETKVYKFEELSDEAKKVALEKQWQFEIETEWWEFIYSEAEELGFRITGFDINYYCDIERETSGCIIAEKIIKNHGKHCDTYKTAKKFLEAWKNLVSKYDISCMQDDDGEFYNESTELEEEFTKALSEDYRILLRHAFEALSDEDYLIEIITINGYEFTEDGELI